MSITRQRFLIFFVPLFLALPFLNRAYFVDDSYFVEIATWLKSHPDLPYHFHADDAGIKNRGWEEDGFVRMVNPLVHQYYLALLLKIGGEREWILRLGCVFLSCFSALFLFELARRWTMDPFISTLLVLVTPAIWLSSYSLLIDSTMVFFAFGSIYFYIRATEKGHLPTLLLSGLFMGFAILSKYPALYVLPLTATWLILRWKKLNQPFRYAIPWLIGLAMLLAYSLWTQSIYGAPHIIAASKRMVHLFGWPKLFSFFVFLSGSLLVPVVVWLVTGWWERISACLVMIGLSSFFSSSYGGFTGVQGLLLGFWLLTSFLFLGAMLQARSQMIYPRDIFLALWVMGFIAMMLIVMDWVAARYFCLVAPAVVFFGVRLIEMKFGALSSKVLKISTVLVFFVSASLAYCDYQQAAPARLLGPELKSRGYLGGERHFYLGDSFTMSYLRKDGWIPCFPETTFQVGDWILAKEVTMPLIWFARRPIVVREISKFEYPSNFPLKVMDLAGAAGFYASVWGALPFTFSTGPWERFRLFEVTAIQSNDAA